MAANSITKDHHLWTRDTIKNVSGDVTLDIAGDISLDAGGGDVTVLQADLTIPVDKKVIFGNTGEYIVGDDTDLDIVSSNDATINAGGDIILDADGDNITMLAGANGSGLDFIQSSSGDYTIKNLTSNKNIYFNVNELGSDTEVMRLSGATSSLLIASGKKILYGHSDEYISGDGTDLTIASGGDVVIDAEDDIILNANGGNISTADGLSAYVPTAGADVTNKTYVDANQYHFIKCGFSTSSVLQNFIPLSASDSLVETTSVTGLAERLVMICPFDGSLETIWARATGTPGFTVIGFHLSTTTDETPSATATQTVTVDMSVDDTSYEFDFASAGTNTFSQGDTIMFSIDPTSRMYDIHFMIVLKFDVST